MLDQEMNEREKALAEAPVPRIRPMLATMKEKNLELMRNDFPEIPQDVKIYVGNDRQLIQCHKWYLLILSTVFEKLLQKDIGQMEEIELKEYDPLAVTNIITYAYIWEINISSVDDAINTAKLASWCQIPEIVENCSKLMINNLNLENVVEIYEVAVLLKLEQPKRKAYDFIIRRYENVSQSEKFHLLSKENLRTFLQLDNLNVHSEHNLCFSLIKWGESQCQKLNKEISCENIRLELDYLLYYIRFPTLVLEDFAELVRDMKSKNRQILNETEITELFLYLSDNRNPQQQQQLKFLQKSRDSQNIRTVFFQEKFENGRPAASQDMKDSFQITSTTHRVSLKSVGFAGGNGQRNERVVIEMKMLMYDELLEQFVEVAKTTGMTTATALKPFYLSFDEPIPIKSNAKYQISYTPTEGRLFRWKSCHTEGNVIAARDGKPVTVNYMPSTSSITSLKFDLESLSTEEEDEGLC